MRLIREAITSFAGGVSDSVAPDEYGPTQTQVLLNARPSLLGNSASPLRGQRYYSAGHDWLQNVLEDDATCFAATEFVTGAGVRQIVGIFREKAFVSIDGGATFDPISGAIGLPQEYWSTAVIDEGGTPKLCFANGGTSAYQWDGTTWSTITGIPSGVKYLATHGNRLIAAGHNGADVVASKVSDIDVWASPDGWTVNADDGSDETPVTGLFVLGGVILVFKAKGVGYVEGYGYQTLQVAAGARGLSRSVGCSNFRTIAPAGDHSIMWLSERGFEIYELGGRISLASTQQQRFVDRINRDTLSRYPGVPTAVWSPTVQEYWCAVPVGLGTPTTLQLARNTWTYVFRAGNNARPPSTFFFYPTKSSSDPETASSTLVIDANGFLDISVDDRTKFLGYVNDEGFLDLSRLPGAGLWAYVQRYGTNASDYSFLDLQADQGGPASLFLADQGPRRQTVHAGTFECGIAEYDMYPEVDPFEYIRNGGFDDGDHWTVASGAVITGGQLDINDGTCSQGVPYRIGPTHIFECDVMGWTTGNLSAIIGGTTYGLDSAGFQSVKIGHKYLEFVANQGTNNDIMYFLGTGGCDAVIDNVSIRLKDPQLPDVSVVRTRPLTWGDEFTRKKAKRIAVLSAQPAAHTVTVYAVTDGVYGSAHSLAFTDTSKTQELRARVGGRGRIIQAELHITSECTIDGVEVLAQPLRDQA